MQLKFFRFLILALLISATTVRAAPNFARVEMIKNEAGEDSIKVTLPPDVQARVEIRSKKIYGL